MTSTNPTANLPPVRVEPDARRRIRQALAEAGRRIAVLDDPTGSQTVHDDLGLQVWRIARADPGFAIRWGSCPTARLISHQRAPRSPVAWRGFGLGDNLGAAFELRPLLLKCLGQP
jgi:hypothetical protein